MIAPAYLPSTWRRVTLEECLEPKTRVIDPGQVGELPYVGLEHMESGSIRISRHGEPRDVRSAKTLFDAGDLLYGKLRPYLDKAALAECDGICSTDILVFTTREDFDPTFMVFLLHAFDFRQHAISTMTGTNHPRTSWSKLKSFDFACAPPEEQRAISHVLRTVQRASEQIDQVIHAARRLKQSVLEHLLARGLHTDRRDGWSAHAGGASLPPRWKVVSLGDICDFRGGTQPPKSEFRRAEFEDSVRLLQIRDFESDEHAVFIKRSPRLRLVSRDDVLIARYGASIGRVLRGKTGAINVAIVRTIPSANLDRDFLYYLLQAGRFQEFIRSLGGRAAQAGFNKGDLNQFSVVLPPLDEQHLIARHLQSIDEKLAAEEEQRDAFEQLFKTLLHELMTGKTRLTSLAAA